MTFSVIGRCLETGMFGVAIATSSICVGARCPHARAGVGAVATQNVTNPQLGPLALDAMAARQSASEALATALASERRPEYRQVTVLDAQGGAASHTGANILGRHALIEAENCVAAGNLLRDEAVPLAMAESFVENVREHLAERLLRALEAGELAGGEEGPTHSAALLVVDAHPFPLVDLRVDWLDEGPIARLRGLWRDYRPQMSAYRDRAVNPSAAPSYGVPGDE